VGYLGNTWAIDKDGVPFKLVTTDPATNAAAPPKWERRDAPTVGSVPIRLRTVSAGRYNMANGATYGVTKDGFLVRWHTHAQDGLTRQNTRDGRGAWQLVTPLKVDAVAVAGDRDSPVAKRVYVIRGGVLYDFDLRKGGFRRLGGSNLRSVSAGRDGGAWVTTNTDDVLEVLE
jgi:hypothetical protein